MSTTVISVADSSSSMDEAPTFVATESGYHPSMEESEEFIIEPAATSQPSSFTSHLRNSFFSNRFDELAQPHEETAEKYDFATLITVVSWLYSRRNYLPFHVVDLNRHESYYTPIAAGSTFSVTSTTVTHNLPSTVHHDINQRSEVQVVVKQSLGHGDLFDHNGQCLHEQQLKSFLMELLILDSDGIYDDENIVRLLGVHWFFSQFTVEPTVQPRLVLERADDTLSGFLSKHPNHTLTWEFKLKLCLNIARGLASLHARDIIHGDVTLNNILIFKSGSEDAGLNNYKAKIADFGHSFIQGTRDRAIGGTPGYMAPEVVDKQAIEYPKAIDVYALGIILWALLVTESKFANSLPSPRSRLIDVTDEAENDDTDIRHLLRIVQRQQESHADEMRTALCKELIRVTIRYSPRRRNLSRTIEVLENLLERTQRETGGQTGIPQQQPPRISTVPPIMENYRCLLQTLLIDYPSISSASGVVHDQLIRNIERIAQDETDIRCPRASWELASLKIARLGNPNDIEVGDAVPFIIQAAERGNMTAQGYCKRLLSALDPRSLLKLETEGLIEKWLFQAAVHGNEAAYEDWKEKYFKSDNGFDQVKQQRLVQRHDNQDFAEDLGQFKSSMVSHLKAHVEGYSPSSSETTNLALLWAARYDHFHHIDYLIKELNLSAELWDEHRDTPLIVACEAGSFNAARALLLLGVPLDHKNKFGETAMHHLWRFSDSQAKSIFLMMSRNAGYEQAFFTEAILENVENGQMFRKLGADPTELDPLPLLPGFPVERMVGRGRDNLVKMFLEEGPALSPSTGHAANGNLVRRMILWASRLNFNIIRCFLVEFSRTPQLFRPGAEADPGLTDVENSTWTFENMHLDYMSSVAQGWISSRGNWRSSEHLWRLCVHGDNWKLNLESSISSILESCERSICRFDKALIHALDKRHHVFVESFLDEYLLSHASLIPDSSHLCARYFDPQTSLGGYDYFQNDPNPTPLIDRILFNKGTLLQQAIMIGDRILFTLLTDTYGADVLRPWSSYKAGNISNIGSLEEVIPLAYINCYSLLAIHSKDVWFAERFYQLGVPHMHLGSIQERYRRMSSGSSKLLYMLYTTQYMYELEHYTPLYFAIDRGFLYLAKFLLSVGASLDDQVNHHSRVLDMVLQPLSIRSQTLEFLFSSGGKYRIGNGPERSISSTLLPKKLFIQGNGIGVFTMVRKAISEVRRPCLLDAFRWVFSKKVYRELSFGNVIVLFARAAISDYGYQFAYRIGGIGIMDRANLFADFCGSTVQSRLLIAMEYRFKDDAILPVVEGIWNCLENMFPHSEHRATWKYPSLLCLATSLPKRIPTRFIGDMPLAFPEMAYITPWEEGEFAEIGSLGKISSQEDLFAKKERRGKFKSRVFESAIAHIIANTTNGKFEPSLYDTLISNDFDICPSNSKAWSDLFDHGYRHGALYFFEVYLVYMLFLVTFILYFPGKKNLLYLSFLPITIHVVIAEFLYNLLPDNKWVLLPIMAPYYISGVIFMICYFFFVMANLLNPLIELLIIRPIVRYKMKMFLMPMLRGRTPYTGYTRAEYFASLKRSVSVITGDLSDMVFSMRRVSVSAVSTTRHFAQYLSGRSRSATRNERDDMSNPSESNDLVIEPESQEQRNHDQEERRKRRERLAAAGKQSAQWAYKRVLRPAFVYVIYKPLEWTIRAAQWEANISRRRDEMRRDRMQTVRLLAESDRGIGDENLGDLELWDEGR